MLVVVVAKLCLVFQFFSLLRAVVMIKNLLLWPLVGWTGSRLKNRFFLSISLPSNLFYISYSYQVRLSSASKSRTSLRMEVKRRRRSSAEKKRRKNPSRDTAVHRRDEAFKLHYQRWNRSSKTSTKRYRRAERTRLASQQQPARCCKVKRNKNEISRRLERWCKLYAEFAYLSFHYWN